MRKLLVCLAALLLLAASLPGCLVRTSRREPVGPTPINPEFAWPEPTADPEFDKQVDTIVTLLIGAVLLIAFAVWLIRNARQSGDQGSD